MSAVALLIVTLLSGALATVMSVIAWRVAREERERSEARIRALAAEIHAEGPAAPAAVDMPSAAQTISLRPDPPRRGKATVRSQMSQLRPRVVVVDDLPLRAPGATTAEAPEPFRPLVTAVSSGLRFGTVAATGLFVFASLLALAVWLSPGPPTARTEHVPGMASIASTEPQMLELMALGHEREGDQLTVRGVVRNPSSSGVVVDRLAAVVFVFSRDGEFVMSARAPVQDGELDPGRESSFLLAVPNAGQIGRYRVSFHRDEHVVPHVDKRQPEVVARVQ